MDHRLTIARRWTRFALHRKGERSLEAATVMVHETGGRGSLRSHRFHVSRLDQLPDS